ncbi:MAG: hypothetical protein M0C28_26270 [Candidatus Moduliflexus flocculans]|nr:hypothetical protein [Candidatus Moduliflexus flocculans]
MDLGPAPLGPAQSLNIGVGLFAGSILPGLQPADRQRLLALLARLLRLVAWAAPGSSSTTSASTWCRIVGKAPDAVDPLPQPQPRRGDRGRGRARGPRARSGRSGRGGVYGLHGPRRSSASAAATQTDPAHPGGRARGRSPPTSAPSAPRPSCKRQAHPRGHLGRAAAGCGSKLLQEHGIAAVIYGGTFVDEDFRDRKVADEWFEEKYQKKLAAKDFEATTKYRFDPKFETGGTFGVNYATVRRPRAGLQLPQRSTWTEARAARPPRALHRWTTTSSSSTRRPSRPKQQATCGEPCAAVCKKMRGEYKKDYEPYQTMGPLCGIFDQRAAERLNRARRRARASTRSRLGGVARLADGVPRLEATCTPEDLGVTRKPALRRRRASTSWPTRRTTPSSACELLDAILEQRGHRRPLGGAAEVGAGGVARERGVRVLDPLRLHRLRPQRLDGAEPVLDPGRPGAHGHHGQVLHVLRHRVPAAARARAGSAPSGSSRSWSWTTWASAASTAAGPRRCCRRSWSPSTA